MKNIVLTKNRVLALSAALAVLALGVSESPVSAQIYLGSARAVDGDTLDMTGARIRLFGIDAPEAKQWCVRADGQSWACGQEAAVMLSQSIAGKTLKCDQQDLDSYGRLVAICTADRADLSAMLVTAGLAVALPGFSDRYVEAEAAARKHQLGIWSGTFDLPADYRASHPRDLAPPPRQAPPSRLVSPRPAQSSSHRADTYFRSCREAWAAGYAPMRIGQRGYRTGLDGDGDGIACEPYLQR